MPAPEVPGVAAASSANTAMPAAKRQRRAPKKDVTIDDMGGLIGRRVRKWFDDPEGWYEGSVTAYDGKYFRVNYDDGDSEDMGADELRVAVGLALHQPGP